MASEEGGQRNLSPLRSGLLRPPGLDGRRQGCRAARRISARIAQAENHRAHSGFTDADARDRRELIEGALRGHRAAKEAKAIESLQEHRPDELVSSLRNVINILNLFLIRKLLVSENLHHKGFAFKQHHNLSLDPGNCPFDTTTLLPAEPLSYD